jgi:hypothetical protein
MVSLVLKILAACVLNILLCAYGPVHIMNYVYHAYLRLLRMNLTHKLYAPLEIQKHR